MALKEPDRVDQVVIRGDTYKQDVGLRGYDDVYQNPSDYRVVMAFRERQDDDLPLILEIIVTPEQVPEDEWRDPDVSEVVAEFEATPTETSNFPPYDVVAYCELTTAAGDTITRLFNSKVEVSD